MQSSLRVVDNGAVICRRPAQRCDDRVGGEERDGKTRHDRTTCLPEHAADAVDQQVPLRGRDARKHATQLLPPRIAPREWLRYKGRQRVLRDPDRIQRKHRARKAIQLRCAPHRVLRQAGRHPDDECARPRPVGGGKHRVDAGRPKLAPVGDEEHRASEKHGSENQDRRAIRVAFFHGGANTFYEMVRRPRLGREDRWNRQASGMRAPRTLTDGYNKGGPFRTDATSSSSHRKSPPYTL